MMIVPKSEDVQNVNLMIYMEYFSEFVKWLLKLIELFRNFSIEFDEFIVICLWSKQIIVMCLWSKQITIK